uniref:Uncharacterized protein n=1 Tax=Timema poppense TaxID=170557 RepID=A0A7R9CLP7_TIMPO|nr:unnamed protein product [Timema poppensis]
MHRINNATVYQGNAQRHFCDWQEAAVDKSVDSRMNHCIPREGVSRLATTVDDVDLARTPKTCLTKHIQHYSTVYIISKCEFEITTGKRFGTLEVAKGYEKVPHKMGIFGKIYCT